MAETVNNGEMNIAEETVEKVSKPKKVKAVKETSIKVADGGKKKRRGIAYEKKQGFVGFMFTLPWFLGFIMFFLVPAVKSIEFSFSDIAIFENYKTTWNNFYNYKNILSSGADFLKNLSTTFTELLINVPIILIFSLFVAVLLNRKFIGRGVARAVFFLPVIVTTGVVMTAFNGGADSSKVFEGEVSNGILFTTMNATDLLANLGLNADITKYLTQVADRIFDVVWDSGIQIILFLAALQGISPALYEACDVEGATAWEKFWLITFPNVSPIILVNIVYTIVDTFSDPSNPVLAQINDKITTVFDYGTASAMVWVYCLLILAILGIVFFVLKKLIVYEN